VSVIISIAIVAIGYVVMERTTIGRRWYSLGGNREASFLSGISVRKLRFWAFVVSGAGCGLAGILLVGRVASAHPTAGAPYLMNSLAAGFLGMTAFRNGQANIAGTFVGVLILGVLSNGLDITNVNSYVKNIVIGVVIIAAVLAAALARKKGRS
jgi:ribose transport system permease protein